MNSIFRFQGQSHYLFLFQSAFFWRLLANRRDINPGACPRRIFTTAFIFVPDSCPLPDVATKARAADQQIWKFLVSRW
jgi:hypothetical protein